MSAPKPARTIKEVATEFRQAEILGAARVVIARDGLQKASMDRIAEQAGISKGTLYLYFQNKAALFREATAGGHAEMAAYVIGEMAQAQNPLAEIEAYVRATLQFCDDNQTLFRAMHAHPDSAGDPAAGAIDRQIADYVDRLEVVIKRGITSGTFSTTYPRRLARILVEAARGMVIERLAEADPPPVEDDTRMLLDTLLNGIRTA